jgi:hypothetical protein
MKWLLIATLVLALGAPGVAQETPTSTDHRCWYASKSFTKGAVLAQGGVLQSCTAEGSWSPVGEGVSDCLYNDSFYGVGSREDVDDQILECQSSGIWKVVS